MKKETLLLLLCIGLVALNITLLILWTGERVSPHSFRGDPTPNGDPMIEQLELDKEQTQLYQSLRKEHMKRNRDIDHRMRENYTLLYGLLRNEDRNNVREKELFDAIEQLTTELNQSNINHFSSLKKILHDDQIPRFEEFTREVQQTFGHPPRPPHKRIK